MGGNGLKWVQMGDCGLILWENEALPLISSFRPVSDQKKPNIYRKTPDKPHQRLLC